MAKTLRYSARFSILAACSFSSAALAQVESSGYIGGQYSDYEFKFAGGDLDGRLVRADGAYVFPISSKIGLQVDAALTMSRNDVAGGDSDSGSVGANLFYRTEDFSIGAFAGAGKTWIHGVPNDRQLGGGVTANAYLGFLSLGASYGWIDSPGSDANGAEATARLFPADQVMIEARYSVIDLDVGSADFGSRQWRLKGEFQPARWPVSLHAGFQHVSSDSFGTSADRYWLGLRYNFGTESLRQRDRRGASMSGFSEFLFLS